MVVIAPMSRLREGRWPMSRLREELWPDERLREGQTSDGYAPIGVNRSN